MVKNKGFTLIELMIVVAIIGILASIIIPAKKHKTNNTNTIDSDSNSSTMMINGVLHKCDSSGDCEPVN